MQSQATSEQVQQSKQAAVHIVDKAVELAVRSLRTLWASKQLLPSAPPGSPVLSCISHCVVLRCAQVSQGVTRTKIASAVLTPSAGHGSNELGQALVDYARDRSIDVRPGNSSLFALRVQKRTWVDGRPGRAGQRTRARCHMCCGRR